VNGIVEVFGQFPLPLSNNNRVNVRELKGGNELGLPTGVKRGVTDGSFSVSVDVGLQKMRRQW
jgi:hypothetical protein